MSGADFDKEYMDLMVSDHSKALDLFTDEAKDTKDAKFRAAVVKGKTMVAAHKNMAYDLKKTIYRFYCAFQPQRVCSILGCNGEERAPQRLS